MGKYHILKEYANGVMDEKGKFYPYRVFTTIAAADMPAKDYARYFIKQITINLAKAGVSVASSAYVTATIAGSTVNLLQTFLEETFAASGSTVFSKSDLNVLTDIGTAVSTVGGTYSIIIVYAEIWEKEGEYNG